MSKPLVIVESPAKAKTIAKFLGKNWTVEASIGHVRDLPSNAAEIPAAIKKETWGRMGVDVTKDFEPHYIVPGEKKKRIAELRAKLKDATELYLATDEDREGEAISWHLLELLKPKVPVKRMVFHEITQKAIDAALANTREIDTALVDAQESRRILDRLYGYEVSPVMWKKIGPGTSAGRVQSVATRLIVEKERERMAFRSASWWDADVELQRGSARFPASVVNVDGKTLAQGRDFGSDGKLIAGRNVLVLDEPEATKLATGLRGADARVRKVEEKEYKSEPKAPFTTSTMQQEAGRKLGMTAKRAMSAAQSLYQNGYITYMRTDSISLSDQAITAARSHVEREYGREYLPNSPRVFRGKSKNAQEAHEAIRPAGEVFRTPKDVEGEVGGDEARLYELIWKRTVACQMVDARMKSVAATFDVATKDGRKVELVSRGRTVLFDGFLRAYVEGQDVAENAERAEDEAVLPPLAQGDTAQVAKAEAAGHATKPPARYTEASLVQKMEELGIGRPSTYASIIATIQDREYVEKRGAALVPRPLAFAIVQLMEALAPTLVDYSFTAEMEEDLDQISRGELGRQKFLSDFYRGNQPGLHKIVTEHIGAIDPKTICTISLGLKDGDPVDLRVGRYGPYLEYRGKRATLPDGIAPDEISVDRAIGIIETAKAADEPMGHDASGVPVYLKTGRFGPYVQLGDEAKPPPEEVEAVAAPVDGKAKPKKKKAKSKKDTGPKPRRASLLKSMSPKTLTLEQALQLLTLPRALGEDVDGNPIVAALGRFGPYLMKTIPGAEKPDYRNLKTEDQLFSVTLDEARAIYAQPKRARGRAPGAAPLKELGVDPIAGTPVVVKDGKYGLYLTDGTTNVTLPTGMGAEDVTLDMAARMLAEKRTAGPSKKKTTRRKAASRG